MIQVPDPKPHTLNLYLCAPRLLFGGQAGFGLTLLDEKLTPVTGHLGFNFFLSPLFHLSKGVRNTKLGGGMPLGV